ncbi:hypothetical protein OUZ56_019212 [Daphnia magna]|uniref:Uncharacterized protein n=1 Tax=Daphnia magna TaxID=35525 RepID=A0ABQ9ZB42_9CRUS|nr:hypothetical protein OUZ56_019212 [Daphnia magna]
MQLNNNNNSNKEILLEKQLVFFTEFEFPLTFAHCSATSLVNYDSLVCVAEFRLKYTAQER